MITPWENRRDGRFDPPGRDRGREAGLQEPRPGASLLPPDDLYSFRRQRLDWNHYIRSIRPRQRKSLRKSCPMMGVGMRFRYGLAR